MDLYLAILPLFSKGFIVIHSNMLFLLQGILGIFILLFSFQRYFQVGTVVSGATEFYSSRISKKDRKLTMVEELLADSEFRRKNKRRYLDIQETRANSGKKFRKKFKNAKGK